MNHKFILSIASLILLAFVGYQIYLPREHRSRLEQMGYPGTLHQVQKRLQRLELRGPIQDLKWLNADLTSLSISSPYLTRPGSLPEGLAELHLTAKLNSLSQIDELKQLSRLTLDLKESKLGNFAALSGATSLRELSLHNSAVPVQLPYQAMGESLESLTFSRIPLDDTLAGIEALQTLKYLEIDGMKVLATLPEHIQDLANLETLVLKHTDLTTLPDLPAISELVLVGNEVLSDFSNLPEALETLTITSSPALTFARLPPLQRLTTLMVDRASDISDLAERTPNLTELTIIDYAQGEVDDLTGLQGLRKLRLIRVDSIEQLDWINALELTHLEIDRGFSLPGPAFAALESETLQNLTIRNHGFIGSLDLSRFPNLNHLTLDDNERLSSLTGLKDHKNLAFLTLKDNALDKLTLDDLPALNQFIWAGTTALGIDLGVKNRIAMTLTSESKTSLSSQHLRQLDLSLNPIQDLAPLSHFSNLQSLNLTGTAVTDLSPLANLENLTELDLSGIKPKGLEKLEPLKSLTLASPQ